MIKQVLDLPVVKDKYNEVHCHGEYPFDRSGLWTTLAPIGEMVALKLLDDGILCNKAFRVISLDRHGLALAIYLHDFHYYLIQTEDLEDACPRAFEEIERLMNDSE